LCPTNKDGDAPTQPFSTDDEHGKAIDLIISMMKKGNGEIQTIKQPEETIKDGDAAEQSFCNDDDQGKINFIYILTGHKYTV
jgi:hypothetical protein